MNEEIRYYSISYECDNCYYYALVQIPVKIEAPTYFCCPLCEMDTFRKSKRKTTDWGYVYNSDGITIHI